MQQSLEASSSSFRFWLQREFTDLTRRDPSCSLRAFSKKIGMDASTISQILSGKRKVSNATIHRICDSLGVGPADRAGLLLKEANADYDFIEEDAFAAIADWYHYALLELTLADHFEEAPEWISEKLGISVTEAKIAVERLLRLGLLARGENGRLMKAASQTTNYSEGMTSSAHKEYQRQILRKALAAVDEVPQDAKDITSMTMTIDPAKLPEAKKRIRHFRRDLCAFLESGARTTVYNLGLQLYPISESTLDQEVSDD